MPDVSFVSSFIPSTHQSVTDFSELTTTLEARFSSFADNLQDLLRGGLFPFDSICTNNTLL